MSTNQLRTGKVVRDAVVKLAKGYEGPIKASSYIVQSGCRQNSQQQFRSAEGSLGVSVRRGCIPRGAIAVGTPCPT